MISQWDPLKLNKPGAAEKSAAQLFPSLVTFCRQKGTAKGPISNIPRGRQTWRLSTLPIFMREGEREYSAYPDPLLVNQLSESLSRAGWSVDLSGGDYLDYFSWSVTTYLMENQNLCVYRERKLVASMQAFICHSLLNKPFLT